MADVVNGIFASLGGTTGSFTNQGSGIFGTSGVVAFP
jgi:hypothetical protein